jgi:hypothetical protein
VDIKCIEPARNFELRTKEQLNIICNHNNCSLI